MADQKLNVLTVTFAEETVQIPRYVLGSGERQALIVAGVHGREHTGVWVAYRLVQQLAQARLHGTVHVVPVANPLAYAAESRETPVDGLNLGSAFRPGPATSITEAIANVLAGLAANARLVLDLHAAGEARYLPHVIFRRPQDAPLAASLGFSFAILRWQTREGETTTLLSTLRDDQLGLVLELGGGITVWPEDATYGMERILAFLGKQGWLSDAPEAVCPTPPAHVYLEDARHQVRATGTGAFYPTVALGDSVAAGAPLGTWVPATTLKPETLRAPCAGRVVYLRTRCLTREGNTVAMILPPRA